MVAAAQASAVAYLENAITPYAPRETMRLPDYANSLELIAEGGAYAFYRGSISDAIVSEMQRPSPYLNDRSALTADDFDKYRALWRTPLTGRYRSNAVVAMPPPTSGGIATIEMLNLQGARTARSAWPAWSGLPPTRTRISRRTRVALRS